MPGVVGVEMEVARATEVGGVEIELVAGIHGDRATRCNDIWSIPRGVQLCVSRISPRSRRKMEGWHWRMDGGNHQKLNIASQGLR